VTFDLHSLAQKCIESCLEIARYSDCPDQLTRTFLAPPTQQVHDFLRGRMGRLGMVSRVDAAGNLRGIHRGARPDAPRLLFGSHIDTVPDAGAFDGVLGVVMALALIEALECPLEYDIEVAAFSEEEGVRFGVPFIGSRALIGDIDDSQLGQEDAHGVTLAEAIRQFGLDPAEIPDAVLHPDTFGYVEFHIEQGPVLEDLNLRLGIVEAISGQSRYELTFHGKANHAGTTPMRLRRDALAGAAEWVLAVEREASTTPGLVATVGCVETLPGATNVIPGEARASLDIRHADDSTRRAAVDNLIAAAQHIAAARGLALSTAPHFDQAAIAMDPVLACQLEAAALATGAAPHRMPSGAGHDAMVLAAKIPSAMLFLRSPGGVSHHPDEAVLLEDVEAALKAGLYFLKHLDPAAVIAEATRASIRKGPDCNHSD
jgi:allantoate deiminase